MIWIGSTRVAGKSLLEGISFRVVVTGQSVSEYVERTGRAWKPLYREVRLHLPVEGPFAVRVAYLRPE